jgi:hypothetical protein
MPRTVIIILTLNIMSLCMSCFIIVYLARVARRMWSKTAGSLMKDELNWAWEEVVMAFLMVWPRNSSKCYSRF